MRTTIRNNGKIWVSAQTFVEAFALLYITQDLPAGMPIVFDTTILEHSSEQTDRNVVQQSDIRIG